MLLGKDFVMQGGVRNYLGETEEVNNAPRYWQSSPTSPKTELSYITDAEKKLLLDANLHGSLKDGKPNKGAAGLLSFDGFGDASDGFGGGGADANDGFGGGGENNNAPDTGGQSRFDVGSGYYGEPTTPTTPTTSNNDYQDRIQRISTGIEPGFRPQDEQPFGLSKEEAYRQGRITKDQLEAPAVLESQAVDERSPFKRGVDNVLDFFKSGGLLGKFGEVISPFSEGLQQKAMTFSLNKRLSDIYEDNPDFEDYESLEQIPGDIGSKVRDLESDLQGVRSGTFKQSDFTAKYGSGDVTNPLDASFNPDLLSEGDQRNLQNLFTPELAYAVSGQTPQDSMVNQYFSNMNINQGSPLSSNLQTDYNNAKNTVNSILGITAPTQQFGYSAQPYGLLSSTNMADNSFNIPYLQQRGLI